METSEETHFEKTNVEYNIIRKLVNCIAHGDYSIVLSSY